MIRYFRWYESIYLMCLLYSFKGNYQAYSSIFSPVIHDANQQSKHEQEKGGGKSAEDMKE